MGEDPGARAGWACARGPREVEDALIDELAVCCDAAVRDPRRLARPARVVVPSRSLREHLCGELMARAGRARVGLVVQTLDALALEVLERAGVALSSPVLFPAVVRELVRGEAGLARELADLVDGTAAAVASIEDLLDAGFTAGHAEVLDERIAALGGGTSADRAFAIVRVATATARLLEAERVGHRSQALARVCEEIDRDPEAALPARAIWIHGFSDATGVQADLLAALVTRREARVWLDRPDDPAQAHAAPGASFGARLRERLTGRTDLGAPPARRPPPTITRAQRPGLELEVRAVAEELRRRLDAGAVPERLAVVARDLGRYRLSLRRQLRRLAIPFSGVAEGGAPGPVARRLRALEELLQLGSRVRAERWLDAVERLAPPGPSTSAAALRGPERADLRHALHRLGVARLSDLTPLPDEMASRGVELDARRGLEVDDDGIPRGRRRRASGSLLAAAIGAGRTCLDHLGAWPVRASLAGHMAALRGLVLGGLGWGGDGSALAELEERLASGEGAGALEIDRADFLTTLRRFLDAAGCDLLGGAGGGVQILGVAEARGRTFDELFVLGLNRGQFPRAVAEDPLLPDFVRAPLREVLPDLPIKGEGHAEERFLFAQLVASSPRVHLSCAASDEGGRPVSPSPLFERIGAVASTEPEIDRVPRSAGDRALHAALEGGRELFAAALPAALDAGRSELGLSRIDLDALVRARLAVLRELDPRDARRSQAGPYFGFVGAVAVPADPRGAPLYVTVLESVAKCPWQAFVGRFLHVAEIPDSLDALPSAIDARQLGTLVHAVLQAIDEWRLDGGSAGAWPGPAEFERILRARAEARVRREGIALPGYAAALASRIRPLLDVARSLSESDTGFRVFSVEEERRVAVRDFAGRERALHFRADRVDRARMNGDGLRFVDYKTGKCDVDAKSAEGRRRQQLSRITSGRLLQAQAYALDADAVEGRYLYLGGTAEHARVLSAEPAGELREAFDSAVATLLDAIDHGSFPPLLREPDRDEEPAACRGCDAKQACLRGDSGARLRLAAWSEAPPTESEAEHAARAVWQLGARS